MLLSDLTPDVLGQGVSEWYRRKLDGGGVTNVRIDENREPGDTVWNATENGGRAEREVVETHSIEVHRMEVTDDEQ